MTASDSRTLTVEIISVLAVVGGGVNGMSWRGEVPLSALHLTAEPDASQASEVNAELWRIFNRADEALVQRLGYRLPSLSVGDLLAWGGATYRVASPTGYDRLADEDVLTAVLGRAVPRHVLSDMRTVVDYDLPRERRDYEERPADEREGHVYETLTRLDSYLDAEGVQ